MANFHFIAGDGKPYGPYSAEQMRQFIAQNRVNAQTQVSADGGPMQPVGSYPELMGGTPHMGGAPQPMAVNPAAAQSMVNGPAIFMIVLAVLSIPLGLFGLGVNLFADSMGSLLKDIPPEITDKLFQQSAIGLAQNAVSLIANIIILIGAIKMRKCQSYGLAMTASILCILCDWGCCCLGLGAGIWSIVVLSKPEVKAAFR